MERSTIEHIVDNFNYQDSRDKPVNGLFKNVSIEAIIKSDFPKLRQGQKEHQDKKITGLSQKFKAFANDITSRQIDPFVKNKTTFLTRENLIDCLYIHENGDISLHKDDYVIR